ncbi:MAG TPA: hypothetical protein VNG29_01470 [Candidatus Paceibacterota bacterium]|nr:hypothetical protein [Candidatus Paceibacterota bacterium]
MKKLIGGVSSAMLVLSAFALPALAAPAFSGTGYSLFDSAHYVSPGEASNRAVQLVSNATSTDGGIDYGFTGSATLADINHLSTDYLFEAGSCGGGSPRFQVNVDTGSGVKNVFVYIGPGPSYTGCPMSAWTNSGELVGTGTVDTSQLPGGTFYDTWAHAESAYGAYPVTGIQLVADGGWAMPTTGQIVDIDNTVINSITYDYEVPVPMSLNQCKNGGWQNYADASGHAFKNQGDCVSYVATGGKNPAAGQ